MNAIDYLIMRTPRRQAAERAEEERLGESESSRGLPAAADGQISGWRIMLSLIGVVLGILASFFVTDLVPPSAVHSKSTGAEPAAQQQLSAGSEAPARTESYKGPRLQEFSWNRLLTRCIISLVICGLTYQTLYFSLKLYDSSPVFLILFVSFQYGYFWQSVIKGGAAALTGGS
jgi:hypothetical protein